MNIIKLFLFLALFNVIPAAPFWNSSDNDPHIPTPKPITNNESFLIARRDLKLINVIIESIHEKIASIVQRLDDQRKLNNEQYNKDQELKAVIIAQMATLCQENDPSPCHFQIDELRLFLNKEESCKKKMAEQEKKLLNELCLLIKQKVKIQQSADIFAKNIKEFLHEKERQ